MTRVRAAAMCIPILLAGACSRSTAPPQEAPPLERDAAAGLVKGRFEETDIGKFDLADGIAWREEGRGTVVYVTSKPIASSMLARSACPATMARAMATMRDAGWVELTFDANGTARYLAGGVTDGARMRANPDLDWSSTLTASGDRVSGSVTHKYRGNFEFELPLSRPRVKEVSEDDRMEGREADPSASSPSPRDMAEAYRAAQAAALQQDWDALLEALGFNQAQVSTIRALPDIDADLLAFADRFLTPGEAGETEPRDGHGFVGAAGVNGKGAKFTNYYWFTPCQETLVLYMINVTPQ